MLSAEVLAKLNEQVGHELYSSHFYLQMSAWCAAQGLDGCARFLRVHSQEELGHMYRLFDYVSQSGEQPVIPALEKPPHEFGSVREVFERILEHERFITARINDLVATTFERRDFFTFNFLQWYVAEQHEEEALFKTLLDKLTLVGTDDRGLYFFDAELSRAKAEKPAASSPEATD
ncbi:MAG: non-heme ferritin [Acidobacteria bacterium]|nr:non-heme ferritin [Acidobacteriota bacterium]